MSKEDTFHLGVKALIRSRDGRVLLLQVNPMKLQGEHRNYWDLPGGRIEKGSSIEDTLRREILEETGITKIADIKPVSMVMSNLRIPIGKGESVGLILSIYSCLIPEDMPITLSDEHVAYAWFTLEKTAELLKIKYPEDFCKAILALPPARV